MLLAGINHVAVLTVTGFGHILSLFFRDPDGLEAEMCVANPDPPPGVHNPPGTPAPDR